MSATTERRPSTSVMFVYSLLLHHISATSDTAVHIGRGAVLAVVITHGRQSNDTLAIYHTKRLPVSRYGYLHDGRPTRRWPQLQCLWTAQPTMDTAKVPMSLSLTSCTVEQRRREHGVASTWF